MFYVFSRDYVGVNQDDLQYLDVDTIEVTQEKPDCSSNHNDWSITLLGEFDSLSEVHSFLYGCFKEELRNVEHTLLDDPESSSIETYKRGKYAPMGQEETELFLFDGIQQAVSHSTSDKEADELLCGFEESANIELGKTLNPIAIDLIKQARTPS